MPPVRGKGRGRLLQILGYSLSAGCLIFVLWGYPFSELVVRIRELDWRWVILGVAADLGTYVIHAWRWNTVLNPVVRPRFWRTVQAIYIGLFANEVLPLRTGEVIRCYLAAVWNNLRLSLSLASAGVERILDGLWMLVAFVITANYVKVPEGVRISVEILAVLVFLGVAAMFWALRRKQEAHAVFAESRWASGFRHIIEGLHLMGDRRTLMRAFVISFLYLALQILPYFALLKADHFDLGFWTAAGILTLVRLGTVIPNAPGNLGVFQLSCVKAMGLFDVEANDAKTFSFILFFALTMPLLIGGAVATALTGLNLGELRERARRGTVIAPPEGPDPSNRS